jgi:hypothetical protein
MSWSLTGVGANYSFHALFRKESIRSFPKLSPPQIQEVLRNRNWKLSFSDWNLLLRIDLMDANCVHHLPEE